MSLEIGFAGIGALFVLLFLRVPVAIALILVSFFGIGAMLGWTPAFGILQNTPYSFVASWTLSAVPMFLLMGFVAYHAALTAGLFEAARVVLGRVPGGLAISSIFACSGFAAVSGSSLACAAAMGRIAVPEMVKAGYKPGFACGAVAAGGTIGALIPPSILMIIYGVFAETSISKVFVGGIGIGLLTAVGYSAVVLATSWLRPGDVPRRATAGEDTDAVTALLSIWPALLLVVLVFGGLFSGLTTATEAGAIGALGAILVSALTGRLNRQVMVDSLLETLKTCAALFIIGIGAAMFTRFLGISGMSSFIAEAVGGSQLGYFQLMLTMVVIYLILGMFMEPFGAMLITLPVFLPVLHAGDISLVWFGVLVVKLLEIGMITPPVGLNVFVIHSVAGKFADAGEIFRGVVPFILADLVIVALIVIFPGIVLFLPDLLFAQ